jgi:hypothetical protein
MEAVSAAAATPPTFSGAELAELLALIREADSVELKVTVPESDQRSTVVGLGLGPLEAKTRKALEYFATVTEAR